MGTDEIARRSDRIMAGRIAGTGIITPERISLAEQRCDLVFADEFNDDRCCFGVIDHGACRLTVKSHDIFPQMV